jgi:hypothetical protein
VTLKKILPRLFCLSIILACLNGCVPAVDMSSRDSSSIPTAEQNRSQITVGDIVLKRPSERGGNDGSTIGRLRGGFGNPFAIHTQKGKELGVVMQSVANTALQNLGPDVSAAQHNGAAPRLEIDVVDFWCDGYMAYNVKATINVRIIRSNTVIAQETLEASQVFMLSFGYSPMPEAYRQTTKQLTSKLTAFLQSEDVNRALAQKSS